LHIYPKSANATRLLIGVAASYGLLLSIFRLALNFVQWLKHFRARAIARFIARSGAIARMVEFCGGR